MRQRERESGENDPTFHDVGIVPAAGRRVDGGADRQVDDPLGVQPRQTDPRAGRAEVRGYGALVNDDSQFLCNPEICAFRVRGELITQWQANIGLTLRF